MALLTFSMTAVGYVPPAPQALPADDSSKSGFFFRIHSLECIFHANLGLP